MNDNIFNEAGFLKNPDDWSPEIMQFIADREDITLTDDIIMYVKSCREQYEVNATVPPLREFSKLHGGDRKGTHLNKIFNGGPMKKIAMLGGLPQPTGCI
jgi:tRNA 2-thiouridine synthesizing protein E